MVANAQCSEVVTATISLSVDWIMESEAPKSVTFVYTGPHTYAYDLMLTIPGESSGSWTADDERALLEALGEVYSDSSLVFVITALTDVDGQLVITVTVAGFRTFSAASASHSTVSTNGLPLSSDAYNFSQTTTALASAPVLTCNLGFAADSEGVCTDADGCIENSCGHGACLDTAAPGVGYSCTCDTGYSEESGVCVDTNGCDTSTCGTNGVCVDVAAPGTGFACNCNPGYVSTDLVCSNELGCASDPTSCANTDSGGLCIDVAPPGQGFSCTCSTGYLLDNSSPSAPTCTIVSCPSTPTQTNYVIAAGSSTYGATRTVSCATGYSGTASAISCQASGGWTSSTGCALASCGTPTTPTGYALGSGGTTYGSSYSMTCATGYTGAATSISCSSGGTWSTPSGCTIVSCPSTPTQTNYVITAGSSTYGATRTVSCATGYSGTASAISCQASGGWTSSTGCAIVNCGTPTAPAGYANGSGSTTYGSTFTQTCANGYSGSAPARTCQADGTWSACSGCTIVSCPSTPAQTGYTIATGASTYGSTRTTSCASGYTGSGASITCQASGSWTTASGCNPSVSATCATWRAQGYTTSGVYAIQPDSNPPYNVYCDMTSDGGGWTVFQRRVSNSDFQSQTWQQHVDGFGSISSSGNYWLGLQKIYLFALARASNLRIDLANGGTYRYAKYSSFGLTAASDYYRLQIGGYSGDANDALYYHHNMQYSTWDADHDRWGNNCANYFRGGFWYDQCCYATLNGPWGSTTSWEFNWYQWLGANTPPTYTQMAMREVAVSSSTMSTCKAWYNAGFRTTGVYKIQPESSNPAYEVLCDQTTDGGGWTVFQRRYNADSFFHNNNWASYKAGFGVIGGNYWLGNDRINRFTTLRSSTLRVDLAYGSSTGYAKYSSFSVGPESDYYRATFGTYSGTTSDSLWYHSNRPFSTIDRDHDSWADSCAGVGRGAWWFGDCNYSSLNGPWASTNSWDFNWYPWLSPNQPPSFTQMAMREAD